MTCPDAINPEDRARLDFLNRWLKTPSYKDDWDFDMAVHLTESERPLDPAQRSFVDHLRKLHPDL